MKKALFSMGFYVLFHTALGQATWGTAGDTWHPNGKIGLGISTNLDRTLTVNGGVDIYGEVGGDLGALLYHPIENGVSKDRWFLRLDNTNNASFPYLSYRTRNGKVVVKTGTAAGGGENTHFTIEGGDGPVNAYFEGVNLGIGTTTPNAKFHVMKDGSNGASGLIDYGIVTVANSGQATLGAEAIGDLYANLNLGSNISGTRRFWHISKRPSSSNHSLQFYYNDGIGFGSSKVTFDINGRVGIGTSTPAYQLTVNTSDEKHLRFENGAEYAFLRLMTNGDLNIWSHGTDNIVFTNGDGSGTETMRISSTGNVGIGSDSPVEKLTVDGNIRAEEVKVEVVNGPDYVFEPDYDLPSLHEIETYIHTHKHLPEIPSAKEMEKDGVQLGEMNMLLLKKIEELTLHLIRQQKEINDLKLSVNKNE